VSLVSQNEELGTQPDADTEELETIDLDTIHVVDERTSAVVPEVSLPPSLAVQNNDIVTPAAVPPAPTPPKVSQIGKFSQSSQKSGDILSARQSLSEEEADDLLQDELIEPEQVEQPKVSSNRRAVRKKR